MFSAHLQTKAGHLPCTSCNAACQGLDCCAPHLCISFQHEVTTEVSVCSRHGGKVQLADAAAVAQEVLLADGLHHCNVVGILEQLIMHKAVVKAVDRPPEGEACGAFPRCCNVNRGHVWQYSTTWFQPPAAHTLEA